MNLLPYNEIDLFESKDYRIKNKRSCNDVLTCVHECFILYIILEVFKSEKININKHTSERRGIR